MAPDKTSGLANTSTAGGTCRRRWQARALLLIGAFLSGLLGASQTAGAADFSRAKKVYVPPTRIQRRIDYYALREGESTASGQAETFSKPASGKRSHNTGTGLVPPPPAVAPPVLSDIEPSGPWSNKGHTGSYKTGGSAGGPIPYSRSRSTAGESIRLKASRLAESGRLADAKELLERGLRLAPGDRLLKEDLASIYMAEASARLQAGSLDEAAALARQSLDLGSESRSAEELLSTILKAQGIQANDPEQRLELARQLGAANKLRQAEVEYRQALKIKRSAPVHIGLGALLLEQGKKASAKLEYDKALALDPTSSEALRQLGILKLGLGDTVRANADLSQALELNPADTAAARHLIGLWQKQVSRFPNNPNSHLGLARVYQLAGDLNSAQGEYRQVVRLDPNHPNLPAARRSFKRSILRQQAWRHFQAARTLADQGALAEAQQMLIEALSIDPASTQARLYQGELFERSAEYSRAREAYLRILKDDPNNIAAARRIYKLPAPDGRSPPAVTGSTGDPFSITGLIPEDPPGTAYPASPAPDQITSLSNFVISLRNHTLGQDAHIQEAEARTRSLRDALARSITGRPAMRSPVSRKFLQPGSLESLLGGSAAVFVEAPPALPGMKETLIEGKASTGGSDPPVAPSRRRPGRQAVAPATIPPPGRPVLFELLRVHADRSSVRLQVALRNRGPTSISLPGSPTALVRSPGNPDRKVKIRFSGKVVPAGGNLTGTVRVPGNPLSPGATIVLTDLDPADFGSRRLYLTAAGQML